MLLAEENRRILLTGRGRLFLRVARVEAESSASSRNFRSQRSHSEVADETQWNLCRTELVF